MTRIAAGLFLITLTTLMLELTLIRVLDVLWYPNMAYMVITLAMFCFGLAGVYSSLKPAETHSGAGFSVLISRRANFFAVFALAILPVMNAIPFDFNRLTDAPVVSLFYFGCIFLTLATPFFFSGLVITGVFSAYAGQIQALYFWDLIGAALGCIILVPFLPKIGTGGLIFLASAFSLWASGLFSENKKWRKATLIMGLFIVAIPFYVQPAGYLEFTAHSNKRGVMMLKQKGRVEMSRWDPISKIDVIDSGHRKFLAYDGGSQSSYIYSFDGELNNLRRQMPEQANRHFWGRVVLASHFLKRDTNYSALIIGSAGGQETKAALIYGAGHVDAVELVEFVVWLGKEKYAAYNGGIFNHPHVNAIATEGRSFLRASNRKYDIIQMFSNHTSSSIAAGSGAMAANYLQTAEAYQEYFAHLSDDGILHINHHVYPRMITTAALAWKQMGRKDFEKHVVVYENEEGQDNLPTLLIKMNPWSRAELDALQSFFDHTKKMVINPLDPSASFLPVVFFSGDFPRGVDARIPYYLSPAKDDKPFFNFLRKVFAPLAVDAKKYVNASTAGLLNSQLQSFVPMDVIHLIVTGMGSLIFAAIFILVPLYFSRIGKSTWYRKKSALIYFACLGAGFIIIELVLIQIFMKLIGYPLYTYSTVVFALLLAAGCGSLGSRKFQIGIDHRWQWPFWGIFISGLFNLVFHTAIFNTFLVSPVPIRIAVAVIMILPMGFFLGMPFPLGILAIERAPQGAIGWAWGMNALFTVVGGLLSVVLSIFIGFKQTILVALVIYALAYVMFQRIRRVQLGTE